MILSPLDLAQRITSLWNTGLPPGFKTGWPTLDKHYTVVPGQLTIVTGWPGSGKSELVDALAINLLEQGWGFSFFSPENQPYELHVAKLYEKFLGKPFGTGPTERQTANEVSMATTQLEGRVSWIQAEGGETLSLAGVLENATRFFSKARDFKHCGLVIDPWNELDHLRPQSLSETEYISQSLTALRNWARAAKVHVWLVAHPQKLRRDDGGKLPIPRPDSISGSQHWWNKGDALITVHRDMGDDPKQDVEVHVWKVRFKHVGRPGMVVLKYDRITGRYFEPVSNVMDFKVRAAGVQDF
jgi:twinkle protein